MNEIYKLLEPHGFIPGYEDVKCNTCGLKFALMDPKATTCKRCARRKLIAAAGYPQDVPGLMRNGTSNLSLLGSQD